MPSLSEFHVKDISWAAEIVTTVYTNKNTPYTIVFTHCGSCYSEVLLVKELLLHNYNICDLDRALSRSLQRPISSSSNR